MRVLPGLTSTKPDRIPAFLEDLARLGVREIAFFPTLLGAEARGNLYRELERIPGLRCPHVHVRADCDGAELDYLADRFGALAFNVHPRASSHPFGPVPARHAGAVFVENVEQVPEEGELAGLGGLCPDFSHWENARIRGDRGYDEAMRALVDRVPIGCCHVSAIREGVPNPWAGGFDHHEASSLGDLAYLARYAAWLPPLVSLELENALPFQLEAAAMVASIALAGC